MSQTQRVYQHIRQQIEQRGFPPTPEEIARSCQLSLTATEAALRRLEGRRQLVRLPGKVRGIRLTELDRRWWVEEQVYGYVRRYSQDGGSLPSLAQIAEDCGLGVETVAGYVYHLHSSGRLSGLPSLFTLTAQSA